MTHFGKVSRVGSSCYVLSALVLATPVGPATAQDRPIGPRASLLFTVDGQEETSQFRPTAGPHWRDTYAIEGMLIGAAIGGTAIVYVGVTHCESDCGLDKAVLGFAAGAILGAIPGLVIGGMFDRTPAGR